MSDIKNVKKLREATGAGFKDCNLAIKETINNAKNSIPAPEPKKEVVQDIKEKVQGKTVQELDREKLEQKFSKDKKETLN